MQQWFYLVALVISIAGLGFIDWRYKLAFWYNWRRSILTIGIAMAVFIVWDITGIVTGIFFHGGSEYTLPFRILPEFPIEELFFLFLLCYVTLVLYRGVGRWQRIS